MSYKTVESKFINSNKRFCCYSRANFYVEKTKNVSSNFVEIELKYQTEGVFRFGKTVLLLCGS